MDIARSIARWLCAFGIGLALSSWIFIATLQTTILDRGVVKHWLAQSGIFDKGLNIQIQVAPDSKGDTSLVTPAILQQAFAQTFDSAYLKDNSGKVIDGTYDWLEGKAKIISFSIPVQEKADVFMKNIVALVEPKIAALPPCTSRLGNTDPDHLTCLPPGVKATDYANQLSKPSSEEGQFLNAPLTQDSLRGQGVPQLDWLPSVVQAVRALTIALPVVIVVLGALYILASGKDKIRGASRVGRQITINAAFTLIGGVLLWFGGTAVDLSGAIDSNDPQQTAAVTAIINPLVRTIMPDFGRAISLYAGVATVMGLALWVGMHIWHHKRTQGVKMPETPSGTTQELKLPEPEKPGETKAP
jgi:hypothetical protein